MDNSACNERDLFVLQKVLWHNLSCADILAMEQRALGTKTSSKIHIPSIESPADIAPVASDSVYRDSDCWCHSQHNSHSSALEICPNVKLNQESGPHIIIG